MVRVLFVASVAWWLGSCLEGHSCTEIGCSDAATFSFRTPTGAWQDGEYTLAIRADGTDYDCSFAVPDDLPEMGQPTPLDCMPELAAYVMPEVTCMEIRHDDAVSQSCTVIPGQYYVEASILGTPETVSVSLERDAEVVVEENVVLDYQESRPNGPDCEPLCRQATAAFTVP
jgi:hypothetical protein